MYIFTFTIYTIFQFLILSYRTFDYLQSSQALIVILENVSGSRGLTKTRLLSGTPLRTDLKDGSKVLTERVVEEEKSLVFRKIKNVRDYNTGVFWYFIKNF